MKRRWNVVPRSQQGDTIALFDSLYSIISTYIYVSASPCSRVALDWSTQRRPEIHPHFCPQLTYPESHSRFLGFCIVLHATSPGSRASFVPFSRSSSESTDVPGRCSSLSVVVPSFERRCCCSLIGSYTYLRIGSHPLGRSHSSSSGAHREGATASRQTGQ